MNTRMKRKRLGRVFSPVLQISRIIPANEPRQGEKCAFKYAVNMYVLSLCFSDRFGCVNRNRTLTFNRLGLRIEYYATAVL